MAEVSLPSSPGAEDSNDYGAFYDRTPILFKIAKLSSAQRNMLHQASHKSQALRRQIARGSHVLIVHLGYTGKRFIYEYIKKELGCTITAIDYPGCPLSNLVDEGIIDNIIELEAGEYDTYVERAMEAIACSPSATYFDAVTSFYESGVLHAVHIADALGLSRSPVTAYNSARNKYRTRKVMHDSGLPVPRFRNIVCEDELIDACYYVGFPAILKPSFGMSSMGVTRVETAEKAVEAYRNIMSLLASDANEDVTESFALVFEEYYDGDEFDVDIVLSNGTIVYANVLDNWMCPLPHFQESGRNCPSLYDADKQREMIDLASKTALALGFLNGVLHIELKYTSRGPRIIEVNTRMGGNSVREMHLRVWGVDLVEEQLFGALDIPCKPLAATHPLVYLADFMVNAPYSGIVNSNEWLEFARADRRLHMIEYSAKVGKQVQGPEDGLPDRLAIVIVASHNSGQDACETVRDMILKDANVPVDAKNEWRKQGFLFVENAHPFVWD